jgi:hypothetical protein
MEPVVPGTGCPPDKNTWILHLMDSLQLAVETKTFHSVWRSEKCYVQLFGFINKIMQRMGFAQVN